MARGGKRTAAPGTTYPKRVDLNQPIKAVTGQQYGMRQAMEAQQRAIPLPNNVAVPPPPGNAPNSPAAPLGGGGPPALPGQMDFARETERPNEPVTAGIGGSQNEAPADDPVLAQLMALYAHSNGDPHIQNLIELRANGYGY